MLSQQPAVLKMLPIRYERREAKNTAESLTIYEPSSEAVYDAIVPEYVGGLLWGGYGGERGQRTGGAAYCDGCGQQKRGRHDRGPFTEIQPCAARRHHAEITEIVAGAEA